MAKGCNRKISTNHAGVADIKTCKSQTGAKWQNFAGSLLNLVWHKMPKIKIHLSTYKQLKSQKKFTSTISQTNANPTLGLPFGTLSIPQRLLVMAGLPRGRRRTRATHVFSDVTRSRLESRDEDYASFSRLTTEVSKQLFSDKPIKVQNDLTDTHTMWHTSLKVQKIETD